ncbi:hypothetical protein [Cumulibacter soli]|uniref:hypothetical protein n=1 Tax=Cumulibacter soli TaxID=2546344 RepID=UPI00106727FD|nr:hypothetical protein [Cumulibacter soli]
MQAWTIARLTVRELLRRRSVGISLIILPLAFYLARHEVSGQAVRMLVLGLGWAVATLALFTTVASLGLDRRLRVAGYRISTLIGGRLAALVFIGLVLAAAYFVIVAIDQDLDRLWAICVMMLCAITIGSVLGVVIGMLLRRELEGALVLLTILATQMIADPDGSLAKVMPFWSVRQVATYTIDEEASSYLAGGIGHGVLTLLSLGIVCAVVSVARLRIHPPDRYLSTSAAA